MDERRLLVALALSLLLLTAYSYLFSPTRRPQAVGSPRPGASVAPPAAPAASPSPLPSPPRSAPGPSPVALPAKVDEKERRVEMTSADLSIAFTNRGGRVVSWKLLHFADGRGAPEEMVQAAPTGPRPLDLETDAPAVDARLREALFKPSTDSLRVDRGGPETVRFEFAEGDLAAEKEITLSPRGYLVRVKALVHRNGQPVGTKILWGPGVGNPSATDREVQGYQPPQGVALGSGGVEIFPPAKLAPSGQALGAVVWAGVESHYFAALFVPPGTAGGVALRPVTLPAHEDGKPNLAPLVSVDLGSAAEPALLYVGPKEYHEMTGAGHQLSRLVIWQMGDWIGPPIVVPLMGLVRWGHSHVGNYGWSIVLVTILINLVMAPFRHYTIANGIKMAKIPPGGKVAQARYRSVPPSDPERRARQEGQVKDRAFSGKDVEDALAAAGAALGLPVASLRFVVLDPGSPGRVGAKPTPARIAVILDAPAPPIRETEPDNGFEGEEADPLAGIREVVRALAETAGLDVSVEIAEGPEAGGVRLDGPGRGVFLRGDRDGEGLRAGEHLLQRLVAPGLV